MGGHCPTGWACGCGDAAPHAWPAVQALHQRHRNNGKAHAGMLTGKSLKTNRDSRCGQLPSIRVLSHTHPDVHAASATPMCCAKEYGSAAGAVGQGVPGPHLPQPRCCSAHAARMQQQAAAAHAASTLAAAGCRRAAAPRSSAGGSTPPQLGWQWYHYRCPHPLVCPAQAPTSRLQGKPIRCVNEQASKQPGQQACLPRIAAAPQPP